MVNVIVTAVAAALVGAIAGFFLRKRSSGWCPTCGGPAQLWVARAAADLLERRATEAAEPDVSADLRPRVRLGIDLLSPGRRSAVVEPTPSNPR